jgi:hypothetical protein
MRTPTLDMFEHTFVLIMTWELTDALSDCVDDDHDLLTTVRALRWYPRNSIQRCRVHNLTSHNINDLPQFFRNLHSTFSTLALCPVASVPPILGGLDAVLEALCPAKYILGPADPDTKQHIIASSGLYLAVSRHNPFNSQIHVEPSHVVRRPSLFLHSGQLSC